MSILKKVLSSVLLIALSITTLTSCNFNSYVATVDGAKIPTRVFKYQLLNQKQNIIQQYQQQGVDEATLWSQKDESGKTYDILLRESILKNIVNTQIINNKFDELKLSFTDEELKKRNDTINSEIQQFGGRKEADKKLKTMGITYDDYVKLYEDYEKFTKVFNYYFGSQGKTPTTSAQVEKWYGDKYVRVKHVLIGTQDQSTGKELSASEVAKKKTLADEVLAKAKAQTTDKFDELIEKYNEDPGMQQSPNGYTFSKDDSYVQEFKDAAFAMKVGEIKLVKTEFGYHIMKKYSATSKDVFTSDLAQDALFEMKDADFKKLLDEWNKNAKIDYNDKAISKIDVKTLEAKESTDSSSTTGTTGTDTTTSK